MIITHGWSIRAKAGIPPFEVDKMAKEVISLAQDNIRQEQLMQAALDNANQFVLEKVGK